MAADLTPRRLLALAGDGIGPEITQATLTVLDAVEPLLERTVSLERADIGFDALNAEGTTMPDTVLERAGKADAVLLGPVSHNAYPAREKGGVNPSGVLRKELELYANIRPAFGWANVPRPVASDIDLVVVRENLEGFYADRNMADGAGEFSPVPGVALAMRKITEAGSRRIAHTAFDIASKRSKSHVTCVHKANVMRMTDGLFLETVRDVAKSYPMVAYEEMLVDACAAHLVREPSRFDVILTTNMFGDILSDLASELAGGLGLAGSLNLGADHLAAQAQHGSAPDIAGKNTANPTSLILSLAMLLEHWGEADACTKIRNAIAACLKNPASRTRDLGGELGTMEFTQSLVARIKEGP